MLRYVRNPEKGYAEVQLIEDSPHEAVVDVDRPERGGGSPADAAAGRGEDAPGAADATNNNAGGNIYLNKWFHLNTEVESRFT